MLGPMTRALLLGLSLLLAACEPEKPRGRAQASASAPPRASSAAPAPPRPAPTAGAPNIVFVLADDQRADSLRCMNKLKGLLPNALVFTHHYAGTPLCCPARTTQLTGLYAHHHGVLSNGDEEDGDTEHTPGAVDFIENGLEQHTLARWLHQGGYRTAFFGKYLNGYERILKDKPGYVPPYWDDWYGFPHAEFYDFQLVERPRGAKNAERVCYLGGGVSKGKGRKPGKCKKDADRIEGGKEDENYSGDVLAAKAAAFVADAAKEKRPFFLYLALKSPHGPYYSPTRYQPDPDEVAFTDEAMKRLDGCELFEWKNRPASFNEADVSDKPEWIQEIEQEPAAKLDAIRKMQLVSVLANEDAVETVKAALEKAGVLDNTVIVYVGDNGYAWGEHGHRHKNCAYEECGKVPLVIWDPRRPSGRPTIDSFTQDVDLAPTLLGLANVKPPADVRFDGTNLLDLLTGGTPRKEVLMECWGRGKTADPEARKNLNSAPDIHAAVRDDGWKYIEHYEDTERTKVKIYKGKPDVELYDMGRDPHELDNLARLSPERLKELGYEEKAVQATIQTYREKLAALAALAEKPGSMFEKKK
jgi:N-acetylglucosamine-6-sulfatase